MRRFTVSVARIEKATGSAAGEDVCLTFRFERGSMAFDVPVFMKSREFDDTELVRVARGRLSEIFRQLASQTDDWRLTEDQVRQLAEMNRRPVKRGQ